MSTQSYPTPSPCPRCEGTGDLCPDTPSVHEMLSAAECPDCDGTGEAWPDEPAPTTAEIEAATRADRENTRRLRNGERLLPGTVRVRW